MRRAARTDSNHKRIVKAFKDMGFAVLDISQLKNACDLFVSKRGETVAIEIKSPDNPPSKQRLTKGEAEFRDAWQGSWSLVMTLEDVEELDKKVAEKCRRMKK